MTKIAVRLPEPKKEYTEDNQRQINRSFSSIVEQLNSTFLTVLKMYIFNTVKRRFRKVYLV